MDTDLKYLFFCLKIKNIVGSEWQSVNISKNQWLIKKSFVKFVQFVVKKMIGCGRNNLKLCGLCG
jgi:hypothetical protein